MFSFKGIGADWKAFFDMASVDGAIEHLAVDVANNKLFSSALVEKGRHVWALCSSKFFDTYGQGSFVVDIDHTKKALSLLSAKDTYKGTIENDELVIENEGDSMERTTIQLLPWETHIDPSNKQSSYVEPEEAVGNRRWQRRLVVSDSPLPIPVPIEFTEEKGPMSQTFAIKPSHLREKLAAGRTIGAPRLNLKTNPDTEVLSILIEGERVSNFSNITLEQGKTTITWDEIFDRELVERMIATADDDTELFIAMTDKADPSGNNPGIWVGWKAKSKNGQDRYTTTCYLLAVLSQE